MTSIIRQASGFRAALRAVRGILRQTSFEFASKEESAVRDLIEDVRKRGDRAIVELEGRFTGAKLSARTLRVSAHEVEEARRVAGARFLATARRVAGNIRRFQSEVLRRSNRPWCDTQQGRTLGQKLAPIENVGIYVPAGAAPLPSTLLMTAVPAQVAGVTRIIVCTSCNREGRADPRILAVASMLGLREVFKVGGAQAIAAMAFGTRTIPRVDKIVGPGSIYTVLAKKLLYGAVGIESLPGPSEVAIIADDSVRPDWIAADLLAQAEHGKDSVCALFTDSRSVSSAVLSSLRSRMLTLARSDAAAGSLRNYGLLAVVDTLDQCCDLANAMAPEHLQIMTRNPHALLRRIKHAGAFFLGQYSPVPLGDYVAGPCHVLPTAGTARFSSGLSVEDFLRRSSVISYTADAARRMLEDLETFASAEGLDGHAESLRTRFSSPKRDHR